MEKTETIDEKRLRAANKLVYELTMKSLYKLPYFKDINFKRNLPTFKKYLGTDEVFPTGMIALYITQKNCLLIQENVISLLSDEQLVMSILHEFIHFYSADIEKNITGYMSEELPVTFNEGITQWLTLRILYPDSLPEKLKENICYPASTYEIQSLIDKLGEEKVFSHYFDTDVKKCFAELTPEELSIMIDTIQRLSSSYEEKASRSNLSGLFENASNSLKGKK